MIVDCTTYIVCASVDLDVGGESIPYVAGWAEDDQLVAVTQLAGVIRRVAGAYVLNAHAAPLAGGSEGAA